MRIRLLASFCLLANNCHSLLSTHNFSLLLTMSNKKNKKMKHILIIITGLILGTLIGKSQNIQIVDKITLQPIPSVTLTNDQQKNIITDNNGKADLSPIMPTTYIACSAVGYNEQNLNMTQLQQQNYRVFLAEKSYDLNEVVVSASRFEEKKRDVAQQIVVLKSKELQFMSQQTSADVLQNSGNVFVQRSQMGGGSPVLRGFEANKVLIVVDGVRMNNAIFRGGHLQNVITMDNSVIDKTELVFGAGSVVYGSDALGGVMHFYTKKPQLSSTQVNVFGRFSTANIEKTGHIDVNLGGKKWASLTSFTYSDFDDLRQGNWRSHGYEDFGKRPYYVERINGKDSMMVNNNPNLQVQTGYSQYDVLQKVAFMPSAKTTHSLNLQYSTSSDVYRYDRLTEINSSGILKNAQWYYGPQQRLLASFQSEHHTDNWLYNTSKLSLAFQDVQESRHNRSFGSPWLNHRTENVKVYTLNLDMSKNIGEQELRYGIELAHNRVESVAERENLDTQLTEPISTRYPAGGSSMSSAAAYLTHSWEINDKWILNDGLRYTYTLLKADFEPLDFYPFPFTNITQKAGALNGNIGLVFLPNDTWRVALLGATGFRSPNVDDLTKVFDSAPGTIVVPNPDLRPEYTYNAELSISKDFAKKVRIEATAYYTRLKNALTLRNSTFNGQDSILYDAAMSQVVSQVNALKAYIYGANLGLNIAINPQLSLSSTLNYTFGRVDTDSTDTPLDHIPPLFGKTNLMLQLKKFKGEIFCLYNAAKPIAEYSASGEDNQQYATADGMPAWWTLNLRTSYALNRYAQIQVAVENILDQNYRLFASGISAPGRNIVVTLRGHF